MPLQPTFTEAYNPPTITPNRKAGVGQWTPVIESASRQTGVPVAIIQAVMNAESTGDHKALSPVGAIGLMQLMPDTAKGLRVNPHDPKQNILGGAKYLRQMYDKFGAWEPAIAAYNAGPGAVEKYKGIPPYDETQKYVAHIRSYLNSQNGVK